MFKNFYTTRMSEKGKTLQIRFMKMRRKNGRFSHIAGTVTALIIVMSLVCVLIACAAADGRKDNAVTNLEISAEQLSEYSNRIVGSMMADIAYADGDRVVFYYGEGVYVYDLANNALVRTFDLNKLNCAPFKQGDYSLGITVSADGKTALLVNYGNNRIKNFKNYRLDLENGIAYETKETELKNPVSGFADSYETVNDEGWLSAGCISNGGKLYYLILKSNDGWTLKFIQLVSLDETTGEKQTYYVFNNGERPLTRLERVYSVLPEGVEVNDYVDTEWNIFIASEDKYPNFEEISGGVTLQGWFDQLDLDYGMYIGKSMQTHAYGVSQAKETTEPYLFVFNGNEIISFRNLHNWNNLMDILHVMSYLDNPYQSALYAQTKASLEKELTKLYHSEYIVNNAWILNWEEANNEAFFSMSLARDRNGLPTEYKFRATEENSGFTLKYKENEKSEWREFTAENFSDVKN